jgi:hypothetical protein
VFSKKRLSTPSFSPAEIRSFRKKVETYYRLRAVDRRNAIRQALFAKTNIRDFSIKILEKGEHSVLFRTSGDRNFAKPVLESLFKVELQAKKLPLGAQKASFEVIAQLPKDVDPEELRIAINAKFVEEVW